jgi:hypothetical protein
VLHTLQIPEPLDFSQLRCEIAPDGRLLYRPAPLRAFAIANCLDPDVLIADENWACEVLYEWYLAHRSAGGMIDAAIELVLIRLAAL